MGNHGRLMAMMSPVKEKRGFFMQGCIKDQTYIVRLDLKFGLYSNIYVLVLLTQIC